MVVNEISCEHRFVPLLIRRCGWTVKNIQDTSGARVDIDQTVNPRKIIISGEAAQVEKALRLVQEVLSYPHAQLHHGSPVNASSLQNNEGMDQFAIDGVQHVSTASEYSSVSHTNDTRHFMVHEGINGPHSNNRINPTMSYPHQQMTMPSQDIGINHCTEADQDQACTNVRSNPVMEQNQEQYHENLFGHHVA